MSFVDTGKSLCRTVTREVEVSSNLTSRGLLRPFLFIAFLF